MIFELFLASETITDPLNFALLEGLGWEGTHVKSR